MSTSPAEDGLLTTARVVLDAEGDRALAQVVLRRRQRAPARLSPAAARRLQATLARGLVRALVAGGGWRRAPSLGGAAPRVGRLWRTAPPPALRLGAPAFALLRWLTACDPASADAVAPPPPADLADDLLWALVADRLRAADLPVRGFEGGALIWLLCPDALVDAAARALDFVPLMRGDGATVLAGLQVRLARRWGEMERAKATMTDPAGLAALGARQAVALAALLDAAEAAARPDLVSFLVEAAGAVLDSSPAAHAWAPDLDATAPLAARTEARHAAGAFLRAVVRVDAWRAGLGAVRFFDDAYDAAQATLAHWAPHAAALPRAAGLVRPLDALRGDLR